MISSVEVADAQAMVRAGQVVAAHLRAGDVVILDGPLGAGKTTLARGVGQGLGVRGALTSPTFVLARVHPPVAGSTPLVHVDAYRLESLEEMEALDLDVSLAESITLVEWGKGKVESLAQEHLVLSITRRLGQPCLAAGDTVAAEHGGQTRTLGVQGTANRWPEQAVQALLAELAGSVVAPTP